jgi:hypothetical protein
MAITYTWSINTLEAKIHEDGLDNVVFNIHYRYLGVDNDNEKYAISQMGILNVQYKEGDAFTPYNELTENQIIEWLESGLNIQEMQNAITKEIDLLKNPVNESLTPPWEKVN